ncbi:MAG: ANTAR domain-containing protein [Actinomycetota bacterium]
MTEDNVTQGLARDAADLLSIADGSDVRSLHRLAALAARQVAACSGATSALWRDNDSVEMAATHPDLAELFELAREAAAGPWTEALRTVETVYCADTLAEQRWPEYTSAALQRGVRCTVTLVHQFGPMVVTLTMFGARPRSLDPAKLGVAELLIAFGGATMGNASIYGDSQRTALQLQESAESRMIVDQAKGVLMHALGCSAQEAFERMRQISQTRHVKVTEVAATIISAHRSVKQPDPGDAEGRHRDPAGRSKSGSPGRGGGPAPRAQAAAGKLRSSDRS